MNNNNLVSTKCTECERRNVCSLKKDLETFSENLILNLKDDKITNISENFTIEVNCKHFTKSMQINPYITLPTFGQSYKGIVANPCEECPTGKTLQYLHWRAFV